MGRPPKFDENYVLRKAMLIFWAKGFANTSVRDLENATGLTASSIYNRFGSKQKLFDLVLNFYIENIVKRRISRYLKTDDAISGLRSFFDSTFEFIGVDTHPYSCLLVRTALDKSTNNPEVIDCLDHGASLLEKAFAESLNRAKALGETSTNCDTEFWARHLLVCLNGLLVELNFRPSKTRLTELVDNIFNALPLTQHH